jgi:hypothetical protein
MKFAIDKGNFLLLLRVEEFLVIGFYFGVFLLGTPYRCTVAVVRTGLFGGR